MKSKWGDWWDIYLRDQCICVYCSFEGHTVLALRQFEIDHLIPQSVGGLDVKDNKVLACRHCNEIKSHFDPSAGDIKTPGSIEQRQNLVERAKRYIQDRVDYGYGGPGEELRDFELMMSEVKGLQAKIVEKVTVTE